MKNRFSSNLTLLKPAIMCNNDPCRAVYRVPFCLLPFCLACFSPQPAIHCQDPPTLQDSGVASGHREPGSLDSGQLQDPVEPRENWDTRTDWLWVGKGLPGQYRGVGGECWGQGRAEGVCSKSRRGGGCCSESWPGVEGSELSGSKAKGRRNCKAGVSWGKKDKSAEALWYICLAVIATCVCRKGGATEDLSPWEGLRPRVQGPRPPRDSAVWSGVSV